MGKDVLKIGSHVGRPTGVVNFRSCFGNHIMTIPVDISVWMEKSHNPQTKSYRQLMEENVSSRNRPFDVYPIKFGQSYTHTHMSNTEGIQQVAFLNLYIYM